MNSKSTVAIIQARMGSSRFYGKVLADLSGKTVLWHVWNRARQIVGIDQVVVATSFTDGDRQVVDYCQRNGIAVARGGTGENDVLGRFYDVATNMQADIIVRITADCPMLDPKVSSAVLALFTKEHDYVSNVLPPTFPDGLDTEVFSYETLRRLHDTVVSKADREHVTSAIPLLPHRFKTVANLDHEPDLSMLRWTVDTPEDLEFVRAVYKELGNDFDMEAVLRLLAEKPELAEINKGHTRNEGSETGKKRGKKQ